MGHSTTFVNDGGVPVISTIDELRDWRNRDPSSRKAEVGPSRAASDLEDERVERFFSINPY